VRPSSNNLVYPGGGGFRLNFRVTARMLRVLSPTESKDFDQTMSVRPYRDVDRRQSRQIMVGDVPVGGDAPITVQSMTNTRTTDVAGTIAAD
jgi:hypothetical protein